MKHITLNCRTLRLGGMQPNRIYMLLIALLMCVPAARGQQLLSDPGFENAGFVNDGIGGWTVSGGFPIVTSQMARTGNWSLAVNGTITGTYQNVNVLPTLQYTCSAWAYTPVAFGTVTTVRLSVDFYALNGDVIYPGSAITSIGITMPVNTWTPLSLSVAAPANAAYAQVNVGLVSQVATAQRTYFDDVNFSVPEPSSATLLLSGVGIWIGIRRLKQSKLG